VRAEGLLVDRRSLSGRDFHFELEPRNVFVGKSARIIRSLLTDRDRVWSQGELVERTNASSGLQAHGFQLSKDEFGGPRFVKTIGHFTVPVDFLTERPPATQGTAMVDDAPANILPGINRALASARQIQVTGVDFYGAILENLAIRVCEAGPFLAMKLRAFARRQAPKDAFDILYTRSITTAASTPPSPRSARKFAPAIPPVPMPSPVSTNISATNNLPRPFAPPVLSWGRPHRVNRQTCVFNGCKSSKKWWTPVIYYKRL
jgi:hypothetical protein